MSFLRVTGAAKLDRAFDELARGVQNKAMRPSLRAGAKVALEEMKRRVPVDTGALRRSGKVRAGRRSRKGPSIVIRFGEGLPDEHAAHVELGTRHLAARAFMRSTMDEHNARIQATIADELASRIAGLIR